MEYGSELLLNKLYSQDKEYLPFVLMLSHLGNATINCWTYTVQCSNFQWRKHQQWLPQVTYSPSPSTNSEGLGAVLILWTTTGEQSGSVHTRYMYSVHKHRDCRPMYNCVHTQQKQCDCSNQQWSSTHKNSLEVATVKVMWTSMSGMWRPSLASAWWWITLVSHAPPHMLKPSLDSHHPQTIESELIPQ